MIEKCASIIKHQRPFDKNLMLYEKGGFFKKHPRDTAKAQEGGMFVTFGRTPTSSKLLLHTCNFCGEA